MQTENELSKEIVDAAYHIHAALGPGLLESVYESILHYELIKRGLTVSSQQPIPVIYDGLEIQTAFRADLIINDKVIIEVKATESLAPVHKRQLLTYLRLADKRLGLLINFNVYQFKDGIIRIANQMPDNDQ